MLFTIDEGKRLPEVPKIPKVVFLLLKLMKN